MIDVILQISFTLTHQIIIELPKTLIFEIATTIA